MKVLEVINSLGPTGGGETFAVNFSREMSNLAETKVAILRNNNKQHFIDRLKEKNIEPIILNKKGHIDLKNVRQLRKVIREFRPDYIHTENNALISVYLALRHIKRKNRPFVFHTMHLAPCDECADRFVRIMHKHIFKKKGFVPVAITKKLAEESSLYYKYQNVPYVENGVDLEPFDSSIPLAKRKYDVTVVGRFAYQKNHVFLIDAFSKLVKDIPTLKVAFVGGGELFNQMVELAKQEKVDNNIDFLGVLNSPSKIVNDSKIIALGSHFEANPLSLLEGMGAGCVVVSSNVGGVADIIHEPENGFLFQANDKVRFIEILKKTLLNIGDFEKTRLFNSNYSKQFSMKNCAKNYFDLFSKYN